MTDASNPAIQKMLEQQQQVLALIDETQLKTVWSISFDGSITIYCDFHEIKDLHDVTFVVSGFKRYATVVRSGITIMSREELEV